MDTSPEPGTPQPGRVAVFQRYPWPRPGETTDGLTITDVRFTNVSTQEEEEESGLPIDTLADASLEPRIVLENCEFEGAKTSRWSLRLKRRLLK